MSAFTSLAAAAGFDVRGASTRALTGGCISETRWIDLADGTSLVAKRGHGAAGSFEAEAAGLRRLAATGTVQVPVPLLVDCVEGRPMLLMTAIEPATASEETWVRFGRDLVALHSADVGERYGLEIDNHIGATPQPNGWCDDWVEFNQVHRLGHQVRLAKCNGRVDASSADALETLIGELDTHLPRHPRPALLHGDLWSGNAIGGRDGDGHARIALIDPAVSIGDPLADIAMMRLFGGFPEACFEAHAQAMVDDDRTEHRIAVYQLYHLLNHLNLFGSGYFGQVMSLVGRLAALRCRT
jgi:protein-ribulosamine 3-kinase